MSYQTWKSTVQYDPVTPLIESGDEAVKFFAERDLLGNKALDAKVLWELPDAVTIVKRQQTDGSWKYPGGNNKLRSSENYNQLETFRNLAYLIEMFGFDKSSPVTAKAVDFLFSFQTDEGDIRGILGSQYTPYYTAAMIELFLKAGLHDDSRIEKAFKWLGSIRQDDGGWTIPFRTHNKKLRIITEDTEPLQPDRSKPFSYLITGVVLRAYAAHKTYRHSAEAKAAGELLLSKFFKKDNYPDRASPDFWTRFTYPFWFTDLISATDSLSKLGFSKDEPQIAKAINWFIERQNPSGLWQLKTLKNDKKYNTDLWISLSVCRILKRLCL
jgi:hypothetical protein